MPNSWASAAPMLTTAAHVVLALVSLALLGLIASPFLMRASRAGHRTHALGCFLYSGGLWVLVRGLIGGLGAVFGVLVYLFEKGKDLEAIKKSAEELQKNVSIGWLLMFICAIGLLGLVGERLRQVSEKHHEIARAGFRKLFGRLVASALPVGLDNGAQAVLAYRAVWEECFNDPNARNIDGWKFGDLCERVRLIYFAPPITAIRPKTAAAGASVNVTGSGFTAARGVHFGPVAAKTLQVNSDTEITVIVPPGHGTVNLIVISRSGARSSPVPASSFDYAKPARTAHTP